LRVLVVGRADDGPLPRDPDGQTSAAAGRRRAFRPLARTVRANRPRDLSARGGGAFRGTGASDCGEPRTRHRRRPRRHARQGRKISTQPGRSKLMADRAHVVTNKEQANPYSGSSLVPMLVIGILLTFAGMIAAVVLS